MFLLLFDSVFTQLWSYLLLTLSTYSGVYTSLFDHPDFSCFSAWCDKSYTVSDTQFVNTETAHLLGSC